MSNVLIVDDDLVNTQLYAYKMQGEGHMVELVTNGSDAQIKLGSKFDLVILDVMIPGIDGLSLLQEMRKGVNKNTPAIIFTNLVSDETKKQANALGATKILYKVDTSPDQLMASVREYLGTAPQTAHAKL